MRPQLALDLCLFINGLPVATFELKNQLTKQTVDDAVQQYQRDRSPRELLFQFGRCLVHFAVDDNQVKFCTKLAGKESVFLPFNKGYNDGAGNPPDPTGIKTRYLWTKTLTREGITDIIENYAQIVEEPNVTGHPVRKQIFPRYHQLDVVHKLLADARERGVGSRYLIQHSAGSGKSNSIAWLAHQLVGLRTGTTPLFDSVVVVTDRRLLDKQIKDTSNSSRRSPLSSAMQRARLNCARCCRLGRRLSSRRSRSSPLSWTPWRTKNEHAPLPSSSMRHTPARAGARRPR